MIIQPPPTSTAPIAPIGLSRTTQLLRSRIGRMSWAHLALFLLVVLSTVPLWAAWQHSHYLNDDTYITLTYVKNLVAGRGFVYNHPPATLGTTTPLLTLILAGLGVLLPYLDLAVLAVFFTALCWIGTVWTFVGFRKEWDMRIWQILCIGVVIIAQGWFTFLGMEAYLFAWLLVLSFSLYYRGQHFWAGLVSGLLFLTRGEGVLITVVLAASLAVRFLSARNAQTRREECISFLHMGLGFALPVAIWALYAWGTFGSVIPNTLAAKRAQGVSMAPTTFLQRLTEVWIPSWGRKLSVAGHSVPFIWWMLFIIGVATMVIKRRQWLIFLAWILLYVAGYALLRISPYWWYQLPVHFIAQLLVGLGLMQSVKLVSGLSWGRRGSVGTVLAALLFAFISFVLLRPMIVDIRSYQGDRRAGAYLMLSEWIREHTSPEDSIGYVEIGYLGFYTPNRITDLLGLVVPENVSYVAEGDLAGAFWRSPPDYYVYSPSVDWLVGVVRESPEFNCLYRPVDRLPDSFGIDFVIYRRIAAGVEDETCVLPVSGFSTDRVDQ
jgi:hypothetical protein